MDILIQHLNACYELAMEGKDSYTSVINYRTMSYGAVAYASRVAFIEGRYADVTALEELWEEWLQKFEALL